jgi:hypothetical protein
MNVPLSRNAIKNLSREEVVRDASLNAIETGKPTAIAIPSSRHERHGIKGRMFVFCRADGNVQFRLYDNADHVPGDMFLSAAKFEDILGIGEAQCEWFLPRIELSRHTTGLDAWLDLAATDTELRSRIMDKRCVGSARRLVA